MFFDCYNLASYKTTSPSNKTGNQITGVESCAQLSQYLDAV